MGCRWGQWCRLVSRVWCGFCTLPETVVRGPRWRTLAAGWCTRWCSGSIASHFDGSGRSSDVDPAEGSIPAANLEAVLEHCPAGGDVTYGVWAGFGSWTEGEDPGSLMPGWGGRSYRLFAAGKAVVTQWPGMDLVAAVGELDLAV